jgi:dethiobiotin synthetase
MTGSSFIRLPPGLFITGTGTGAGKTFVGRGLSAGLRTRGERVAALKPIETAVALTGSSGSTAWTDAALLAQAAGRPELEHAAGFYRAALPASPYGVSLSTGAAPPDLEQLAQAIGSAAAGSSLVLVEGAGGLLVPIDAQRTMADLAHRLGLPLLLIAPNALGVLSHALTAVESALQRELPIAALVLTDAAPEPGDGSDPSRGHNAAILRERLAFPVLSFPFCADASDAALAEAARRAGLLDLTLSS